MVAAFVVPNLRASSTKSTRSKSGERQNILLKYLSSIDFIEAKSGLKFFPLLDRERVIPWDKMMHDLKNIGRPLHYITLYYEICLNIIIGTVVNFMIS